jgi:hypothetical protein
MPPPSRRNREGDTLATPVLAAPSSYLLASVRRWPPPSAPLLDLIGGYESGAVLTAPARPQRRSGQASRYGGRFARMPYQRSPEPSLSRLRRRQLGDRGALPPHLRVFQAECGRAYAQLIRERHQAVGYLDYCHDRAAAVIGCTGRQIQRCQNDLERRGLISVERRPQPGRKNLPNIIRIISADWLDWIDRDPKAARAAKATPLPGLLGDIDVEPRFTVDIKKAFAPLVPAKTPPRQACGGSAAPSNRSDAS